MNSENTPRYNEMQLIKRRFFAMRNGVIADMLRKGGCPYPIIFGLNLPQIVEIAASQRQCRDLAEQLWADSRCRESRLMAPMVYPVEEMSFDDARRWLESAGDIETADILCHRLLRRHPRAVDLALEFGNAEDPFVRYAALRLMVNLLAVTPDGKDFAKLFRPFAHPETENPPCKAVSRQLAEELAWRE